MSPYRDKHGILPVLLILFFILTQNDAVLAQPPGSSSPDLNDQYAKVSPSMAIIIVVLIAALFFMGFFSIYVRHCNDSSTSNPSLRPGNLGRSRRGAQRGLEASVIETFPLLHYSEVKGLKIGKGTLECAVCLNEFEDDETLRLIPKCDHVFHPDCIDAWLESHVTCPVCRADLTPLPADPTHPSAADESTHTDLESQTTFTAEGETCNELPQGNNEVELQEPEVVRLEGTLNRNRTRGSRSVGSTRGRWFPRSHSTGHSLVQPGENTDRFTLKLPDEVRKQIMNRQLDRSMSLVVLPRERSTRRGYRISGDGSNRGKQRRLEKLDEPADTSDRSVSTRNPSLLTRASSFLTRASSSIIRSSSLRSPKVAANDGEGTSTRPVGPDVNESTRPPV